MKTKEVFIVGDALFRKGEVVESNSDYSIVECKRDKQRYVIPNNRVLENEDEAISKYNQINNIQL